MFDVAQYVKAEFPKARTAYQHRWWLRRPGQGWESLGTGDLNPIQLNALAGKLEKEALVLRAPRSAVPSSVGELDYWCLLVRAGAVYAVRETRGRLGYGVEGILAADMWAMLTAT